MRSRLLAGAVLALVAVAAWLAIRFTLLARLLQGAILLSLVYVAYLAWLGWRVMRDAPAIASVRPDDPPSLTVLVPAQNESAVIGDCVRDLALQDYAGPLQIIVIDDGSTDGTDAAARLALAGLPPERAARVSLVRREPGQGPATKGAALAYAHPFVTGEVVGVLDADSRLEPNFLERVIASWAVDPSAAGIQAQRRPHNAERGWLTAAQDEELVMDMVSQCGRWSTDGTAEMRGTGMFLRREALERVGGWSEQAITEDLEISTRLAAAGERITLAPGAVLGEEAVVQPRALWRQRMRWAEGSMRRLIELGPGLVANRRLPLERRVNFLMFVTEFVVPPLFVASIAASLITIPLPRPADWTVPASLFVGYGLGTFLLALGGLAAHGERGWRLVGRATRGALWLSHWLIVVPAALMKIAFLAPSTVFARTPRAPRAEP
ncbi:MAG TPA: glycosyltransferase [candidate division Zixibacteria bacterium]|nr:glycosyltransferase [candidate division Zixibacteria bacterium]